MKLKDTPDQKSTICTKKKKIVRSCVGGILQNWVWSRWTWWQMHK